MTFQDFKEEAKKLMDKHENLISDFCIEVTSWHDSLTPTYKTTFYFNDPDWFPTVCSAPSVEQVIKLSDLAIKIRTGEIAPIKDLKL